MLADWANPHFSIFGIIWINDLIIDDNESGFYFSEHAAAMIA
jgi:hypothetical protein